MTSIDIPNSVTWIGERAFAGCSGLPSIDIPNSVTNIGEDAFWNCSGLTSVSIGSRVRFISSNSFYGCIALTSITVSEDNTIFDSRNHCNAIIVSSSNTLKCGCKSTIIPNSVTSIDNAAFSSCRGLTSVDIPNSVTSIGYQAFSSCLLRNVYMNCVNPPKLPSSGSSFSAGTLNHASLYVPYGTWSDYAYNDKWGDFIHIKEMTTSTENLAPRRTYMLMNRDESSYAIYDPTSDEVKSLSSLNNVNEDDPNQCWQMTKVDGETYLYNIGAKKFAKSYTNEVGFTLSDTPCPITMENGEDGIMLGGQRKAQWTFVVNEEQSTNQNLNNVITGIQSTVKQSQENTVDWYTLDGRNMEKEPIEKGVYIVNGKKVYVN